jgi:hypothetical protein
MLVVSLTLFGEDRSSHWKARLTLTKANNPSEGRSARRFASPSLVITRDMNEELLFAILFFGFRRFEASLPTWGNSNELPSPNAGVEALEVWDSGPVMLLLRGLPAPPSLLNSADVRSSPGCSCIGALNREFARCLKYEGAELRVLRDSNDIFVPAEAGWGVVARGFGLIIGASEGCGGGVARCRSSLSTYVPARFYQYCRLQQVAMLTFSNEQLVFGSCRCR